jgi:hypothetical protein
MTDRRIESDFGGIEFIPTTFLIDRNGNLIDTLVGYTAEEDFETRILPLLEPSEPPRASLSTRGDRAFLTWTTEQHGVQIETADSILGPWTTLSVSGVATNGQFEVEIEIETTRSQSFFRLRR